MSVQVYSASHRSSQLANKPGGSRSVSTIKAVPCFERDFLIPSVLTTSQVAFLHPTEELNEDEGSGSEETRGGMDRMFRMGCPGTGDILGCFRWRETSW